MACVPVRDAVRRILVCIAPLLVLGAIGLAISACSRDPEAAQAEANAPIGIETSSLFLTIENRAGTPLVDLTIAIVPAGGTPFTHLISRVEVGEKREASLSEFSSRDGTQFSLRVARPQKVRVQAKDLTGKSYTVEAPWK
jgi:hypothetical protein